MPEEISNNSCKKKIVEVAILFLPLGSGSDGRAGSLPEAPFWRGDMECTALTSQKTAEVAQKVLDVG